VSLPIRQVAYYCADVRQAALAHHRRFGSGPFFVADHIALSSSVHRGVERAYDHSSAYGQWGDVMIEFVQQNNPAPSALRDLYPEGSGRWGLHHVALFVDDVDEAAAAMSAEGFALAQRCVMTDGFVFTFVDTSAVYGHMIELYAPTPSLTGFYAHVARAARDFIGGDIIRTITL
jgi:catechol 2,3-dioxygenase-like lactoylglutathione lyase family enzyme